ncbi:hypothetical protein Pint_26077 [Pistacia integerrima]|uniref:Uncharacterized protein n=1 Tax=Pistacia integerrima TaxID=434235 RepID=A0ACC0YGN1_9ROSI|nr:hypothetical protein Pint_26077 [Pistacia integerrima]
MADRLASFLDVECDRLDTHANAFRNNTHRKQLRLKLAEAQSFLRNHESFRSYHNYSGLEEILYQVDELFDDWEQSEKSKSKIEQEERRIRGLRLVGREKDLGHVALESVVTSEPQRLPVSSSKDGMTSDGFEVESETVTSANIKSPLAADYVPALSPEIVEEEDDSTVLSTEIVEEADLVPALSTEIVEEVDQVPALSTEIVEEVDQVPALSTEIVEEEDQVPAMSREIVEEGDTIQITYLETGGLHFQSERVNQLKAGSNASAKKLVRPTPLIAAKNLGTTSIKEHEISMEGELLQKSGVEDKKSIKKIVRKILSYINDVKATRIGVHGIGGVGKTTVLKALVSHLKTKSMFDVIILVTVSRYWSLRKIQNGVLRRLSLCYENTDSDTQVAENIFQTLKRKKFLLVLDDVWEQIDLKAVGIPDPTSENGCKILMTSRKHDLCHNMNVIKAIEVKTISRKEARKLFYKQVGRVVPSREIQPFAEAIVKGCGGLPLLIIVAGRTLAEENDVCVWKHASRKFSQPKTARVFQIEDAIQRLKFSFDQLKDHDVKSCFLHCALFPEDREVGISNFIDYCIKESIIIGPQADAHKRGCDIIDVLVRKSLLELEVTKDGDSIKMQGLIRDLALGILSSAAEGSQFLLKPYSRCKELSNPSSSSSRSVSGSESGILPIPVGDQLLLRAGAGLTEPPSEEEWKQAKMIFLMDNDLRSLPERPYCPELFTLFLQRNTQLRKMPISFFDSMTSLKVLNLSNTRINSLPKTLFGLKNLQILVLQDCERFDMLPSEVGSLDALEVLDLKGTEIHKLPDEIGKLASLSHLKVSFYGSLDDSEYVKLPSNLISSGTLSRLQALETLSIVVFPGDERWSEDVKFVKSEVSKLKKLSCLSFHFPEIEHVQHFLKESIPWKDQQLTEFNFVVGLDVQRITSRVPEYVEFDYDQHVQCLRFVNGEKKPDEVLQILARSTAFYLDHHLDIESLSNFGVSNINGLKFCIVCECSEIRTIVHIDEHSTAVFPKLENLSIHHLWNLTCIWKGIVSKGSFAELNILSVYACPKLEYVFTSSLTQCLSKLEELTIEECPAIKEIIVQEMVDSSCIALPSLRKLTLHSLPGLINIWKSVWPLLEYISFYDCPKLKKLGMDSRLTHSIIEIKAEKSWWDTLEWEDSGFHSLLGNRLTIICEDDQ